MNERRVETCCADECRAEICCEDGCSEIRNIDLVRMICHELGKPESLITFVADRKGHDLRYALDTAKICELGWQPETRFDEGIKKTVAWYRKALDDE